jgi:transcriptional regulator with XRE-family HTH domain
LLAGLANTQAEFRATVAADSPAEFYLQLAQFLSDQDRLSRLSGVHHIRDTVHAFIRDTRFGYYLRVHRLAFGLSASNLSELTDIDPTWIEAIESDSRFVSKLSLIQLARLCDTLSMTFAVSLQLRDAPFLELKPPSDVTSALFAAAKYFAEYSLGTESPSTRRPMDDTTLLSQWHCFLAARKLAVVDRCPQPLLTPSEPIRVFLCYPLSNVMPAEKEEVDGLVCEITNSLKNSGIQVAIETPQWQPAGRPDYGPDIYLRRVAGLRQTDLAIAFLDPASTGVGIMLQLIHNATIPCLCVTKSWAGVSRMVRGLAPSKLPFIEYTSTGAAGPQIASWLTQQADAVRHSRARRDRAWLRLGGLHVGRALTLAQILGRNVSPMPLFREEFGERLKECDDLTATLTLFQLAYIAIAQQWHLVPSSSGFLALAPPIVLPTGIHNKDMAEAAARTSLSNLSDAMEQIQCADSIARRAWSTYLGELSLSAARKEKKAKTVADLTRSVKEWLRILSAKDEL